MASTHSLQHVRITCHGRLPTSRGHAQDFIRGLSVLRDTELVLAFNLMLEGDLNTNKNF